MRNIRRDTASKNDDLLECRAVYENIVYDEPAEPSSADDDASDIVLLLLLEEKNFPEKTLFIVGLRWWTILSPVSLRYSPDDIMVLI